MRHSIIIIALTVIATCTGAEAQTYRMRQRIPPIPKAAIVAPSTPTTAITCTPIGNGHAAGSNSRRFLGNYASTTLALDACQTKGISTDRFCSAARLSITTSDGPAGSYNAFVQNEALITGQSAWYGWSCSPS